MAEERIDIVVTERGSRTVRREIEGIGGGAQKSATALDFLKKALVAIGAATALRGLVKTLDTFTNLQNRLRATGLEGRNLSAVYKELLTVSNDTRSSLEGSVELYSRLAISSKDLGVNQRQLIDFTKSLNQAIILSGASATEAQAGLIQLSQGMASGTLRGDELRSVLEQLPAVADVIAKKLGVTRGELREMGQDGKITAKTILDAFASARGELEERFGKTVPTIGQSFQVLKNNIVDMVGRLDSATGISKAFSASLFFIANNLDTVTKALISVSAGFVLIVGGAAAINLVTTAVKALTVAIAANPVGFLLVAITSATTALVLFRDEISLGVDEVTTLGDFMRALGEVFGAAFRKISEGVRVLFGPLIDYLSSFTDGMGFSVAGVLSLVARGVDTYFGLWKGALQAVVALFMGLPAALGDLMTRALNAVLSKIGAFVSKAGELLSPLTELTGLGAIGTVDLQITNDQEGAAAQLGKDIGAAFKDGFETAGFAQDFLKDVTARAQDIAKGREAAAAAPAVDLGSSDASTGAAKLSAAELTALQDALDSLVGSYDRVGAAQTEYANGMAILSQAQAAGLITGERLGQVIDLMNEQLRDAMDPFGALNRELDTERDLLKLNTDQREIESQVRSIQQDMMYQGILLGEQEIAQLREKLTLLQEETKAAEMRNQVYEAITGPQEQFVEQLTAINELLKEGTISQAEATAYLVEQNSTLLDGTIEAQQAWVEQYNQTYMMIDEMRNADLISEQTAAQLKARANADLYAKQLSNAQTFFGSLATLSRSENKELAAIGKAAAVTQATIDGVLAVQKALASAPPPVNYALAAAVGVAAAANVAQILSSGQGYAFGGDFAVGGTGGTDSQTVAFRATPGETVSIRTPTQNREEARQGGGSGAQGGGLGVSIVNVLDPAMVGDFLNTPEGEQVLVNVMRRNADAVRQVIS